MPKLSRSSVAGVLLAVFALVACTDNKPPPVGTSGNAAPSASSSSSSSSSAASAGPQKLSITAVQASSNLFVFDTAGVERLTAGDVELTFVNSMNGEQEVRVIQVLDNSVTAYRAALTSGGATGVTTLGKEVATLGPLSAGKSATTTVTLPAGTYVLASFLPDGGTDGKTFAEHGMLRELQVIPA